METGLSSKKDIIKDINKCRKQVKDAWYAASYTFYGDSDKKLCLTVKGFNTWIQRLQLTITLSDNTVMPVIYVSSSMDLKVAEFNEWLNTNLDFMFDCIDKYKENKII